MQCRVSRDLEWRASTDAITIEPDPGTQSRAVSHFGHGILTFHLPCLFRTEPGSSLMVQRPINHPRDGIAGPCRHHRDRLVPIELHHERDLHPARSACGSRGASPTAISFRYRLGVMETSSQSCGFCPRIRSSSARTIFGARAVRSSIRPEGARIRRAGRQMAEARLPRARSAEGHRRRLRLKPFKRPRCNLSDRPTRRRHKG
jgi:hypothetical protein